MISQTLICSLLSASALLQLTAAAPHVQYGGVGDAHENLAMKRGLAVRLVTAPASDEAAEPTNSWSVEKSEETGETEAESESAAWPAPTEGPKVESYPKKETVTVTTTTTTTEVETETETEVETKVETKTVTTTAYPMRPTGAPSTYEVETEEVEEETEEKETESKSSAWPHATGIPGSGVSGRYPVTKRENQEAGRPGMRYPPMPETTEEDEDGEDDDMMTILPMPVGGPTNPGAPSMPTGGSTVVPPSSAVATVTDMPMVPEAVAVMATMAPAEISSYYSSCMGSMRSELTGNMATLQAVATNSMTSYYSVMAAWTSSCTSSWRAEMMDSVATWAYYSSMFNSMNQGMVATVAEPEVSTVYVNPMRPPMRTGAPPAMET